MSVQYNSVAGWNDSSSSSSR